jgi:hypothetical protein
MSHENVIGRDRHETVAPFRQLGDYPSPTGREWRGDQHWRGLGAVELNFIYFNELN